VEHDRDVPPLHVVVWDAPEQLQESLVLPLETVVESLGDLLHVESLLDLARHIDVGKRLLFLERDGQGGELVNQAVARPADVIGMLPAGGWLAKFAFDPLPDLGSLAGVGEYDEVLV